MITQSQLDDASCILAEARSVAHIMIDALNAGAAQAVFGAVARLITSAKEIIDGETPA